MEKTLVYHLYVKDDFEENIAYKIHQYCLCKYIHIFDKVKFTVSLDDLTRYDLIGFAYNWINSIGITCETQINVVKNNEMGETDTFEREILNLNNDGMVFFAHSKGVSRLIDGQINSSVLYWILTLYYENLEFVDDIEKCFLDMPLKTSIFYGTLLFGSEIHEPLKLAFGKHFSGNFYWINMPKYKNWREIGRIPDLRPDGRWFVEIYPNMVCNYEMMGGGIKTKNNVWFEMDNSNIYKFTKDEWADIFKTYGSYDGMVDLCCQVEELIGLENIDFENKTEWDDKV